MFSPDSIPYTSQPIIYESIRRSRLKHRYIPYGGAKELIDDDSMEVIIEGPRGTGKTRGALEKLFQHAMQFPGFRGAIARKVRYDLSESGLVTWERDVLGYDHPLVVDGPQRSNRQVYRFSNAEILVAGLDKPGKLLSAEFDMIVVIQAEQLTLGDWQSLLGSLRNFKGQYHQLIGDCNPASPTHWIQGRAKSGKLCLIHSRHEDNPVYYDRDTRSWTEKGKTYIFGFLDQLTGFMRKRFKDGIWSAAEGQVYEAWNASTHVINRFDIPPHWRKIRVYDFGFTNPFCCHWWAIDPDGRMYLYREIYYTRRLVEDHAKQIEKLSVGESIEADVCDHDAEGRATLERYLGIVTLPAKKAIADGIQMVAQRLRVAGDGKPRMVFLRDSLVEKDPLLGFDFDEEAESKEKQPAPSCTIEEFPLYVYPPGVDGQPNKEVPIDKHNHGLDNSRYATQYVDAPKTEAAAVFVARSTDQRLHDLGIE